MGDILSQEEINELIKALSSGELDVEQIQTAKEEKKIKSYNFRKPEKFAKDHLKTLQFIHENYARIISSFLTGYLRTLVQIELVAVESMLYSDFSNSIANPIILGMIDFTPLSGQIILAMEPAVSYALIDRILGGKGTSMDKVREFTEIELAIIDRVIIQLINLMREPWENVISIRPRLEKTETNAQFAQAISPNSTVALVTLNAVIGETRGMIIICLPHDVIEPVLPKLSTRLWFTKMEKEITNESRDMMESKIANTYVPVRAVLGSTSITVADFLELQVGDVIPIDTRVDGDVNVLVGDLLKFKGKAGVKKNRIAVKITEIIREEDE